MAKDRSDLMINEILEVTAEYRISLTSIYGSSTNSEVLVVINNHLVYFKISTRKLFTINSDVFECEVDNSWLNRKMNIIKCLGGIWYAKRDF